MGEVGLRCSDQLLALQLAGRQALLLERLKFALASLFETCRICLSHALFPWRTHLKHERLLFKFLYADGQFSMLGDKLCGSLQQSPALCICLAKYLT